MPNEGVQSQGSAQNLNEDGSTSEQTQNLNALLRKRGGLRQRITSFQKFIHSLGCQENSNTRDALKLQERLKAAEDTFQEFIKIQEEIEMTVDEIQITVQYEYRCTFEDVYFDVISQAKEMLLQFNKPSQQTESLQACASPTMSSIHPVQHSIRLPPIDLPKFNGMHENWLHFRDVFTDLIHKNHMISETEKLHYLKTSLTGSASETIKALQINSANYSIAWDILRQQYDANDILIRSHVKALFALPSMTKESSTQIRLLRDGIVKHSKSLEALQQPVEQWNLPLIIFLTEKLDRRTMQLWEESHPTSSLGATLTDFLNFLQSRYTLLETIEGRNLSTINIDKRSATNKTHHSMVATADTIYSCNFCSEAHSIYKCDKFLKMSPVERLNSARKLSLCLNCLKKSHSTSKCRNSSCRQCKGRHNTLLHLSKREDIAATITIEQESSNTNNEQHIAADIQSTANVGCATGPSEVLLCTAKVLVSSAGGKTHTCRALLDSGSQANFISATLAEKLDVTLQPSNITINGISGTSTKSQKQCSITVASLDGKYAVDMSCSILPKITGNLPKATFDRHTLEIPNNIIYADVEFNISSPVDLLLGSTIFWKVLKQQSMTINGLHIQNSELGWLLAGTIPMETRTFVCHFSQSDQACQDAIEQFWALEENSADIPTWSICENFESTHSRTTDGRFVINIPFNNKEKLLNAESSAMIARKRLLSVEKRFASDNDFKQMYIKFMQEYHSLGHMSLINDEFQPKYYIPHHGVVNTKQPNKIRVVFDGSAKPGNGPSLNEAQDPGPKLQNELVDVVLRFRTHKIALVADIRHMYRQILVSEEHRPYQVILWREDPSDPIQTYALNTVTYGTASAPYLAIKCLRKLASEHLSTYPVASNTILNDFYVDDVLTGGETDDDVLQLGNELQVVLKYGGFELHKWTSNKPSILTHLACNTNNTSSTIMNHTQKTLGIEWDPETDRFGFSINLPVSTVITKRVVLSDLAHLFDPLGLLGPVIITAKMIMQQLWLQKLAWDDMVSEETARNYLRFREDLQNVSQIKIPRVIYSSNRTAVELHGFCDASGKGYGACVYIRNLCNDTTVSVNLLCAKSRVAPVKAMSTPRLELCGALELAKLITKVRRAMGLECLSYLWCDSQVVLHWIRLVPSALTVYVGNRVQKIQELTKNACWSYVKTHENPADLISRGATVAQIQTSSLWWNGPQWLAIHDFLPSMNIPPLSDELPEIRNVKQVTHTTNQPSMINFERYSSFSKVPMVMIYIHRFIYNCKNTDKRIDALTTQEYRQAEIKIVQLTQQENFAQDIKDLTTHQRLRNTSKILRLSPFIDADTGLLRVGGRLSLATYPYTKKHPALVHGSHHIAKLILREEHHKLLHAGPQQILHASREKYWITSGRVLAKQVVHECVICRRMNSKPCTAIMGDLPPVRVTPSHPFVHTGVDIGGPFVIKDKRGRGAKESKIYICLFVCMSTKCLHLEAITTLSADGFIACLRRFIARRGHPASIHCDNGRNFVGARRKLDEIGKFLMSSNPEIERKVTPLGIQWHFIPPYSPNFGGLWEAGIKQVKFHLKRILMNATSLVYEEFQTLIIQIEGILNSRPLYPMSQDPNDDSVLTPAHFLIGRPIIALSDEFDTRDIAVPDRYQNVQKVQRQFWTVWQRDYLNYLQARVKWSQGRTQDRLQEGTLVLLREDHLPPMQWRKGRVTALHPGRDGRVRVVTVKTTTGDSKRAISKISPLLDY